MKLNNKFKILKRFLNSSEDAIQVDPSSNKFENQSKDHNLLKHSAKHFEHLFNYSDNGMCVIQDEIVCDANIQTAKMIGYSLEELIGKKFYNFIHPDELKSAVRNYKNFITGKSINQRYETSVLCKNGNKLEVEFNVSRTKYKNAFAAFVQVSDISNRKRLEKELIDTKDKLFKLTEDAPDMIIKYSLPDGICEYVNPASTKVCGYTPEEICSTPFLIKKTIHPDYKNFLDEQMDNLLNGNLPESFEYAVLDKEGKKRWLHQRNTIIRNDNGSPISFEAVMNDITEKKEIEIELDHYRKHLEDIVEERTSELRREIINKEITQEELLILNQAFQQTMDEIAIADLEGNVIYVNSSWAVMHGYSQDELIGKNLSIFHTEQQLINDVIPFNKIVIEHGKHMGEVGHVKKDGTIFPTYMTSSLVLDNNGLLQYMIGIARDITIEKQAELNLKISKEQLISIIDSIDDLIFVLDKDGVFCEYHQPKHINSLYLPPEVFIGKAYKDILPKHVVKLTDKAIKDCLTSNETQEFDYYLEIKGINYWFNSKLSPRTDTNNKIIGYTTVVRDITARKKAELSNRRLTFDLKERIKEINCLYSIKKIIHEGDNLESTMQEIVNIIPLGYQYPDISYCKIKLYDNTYFSSNFEESHIKQTSYINLHDEQIGFINVFIRKESNTSFLSEEVDLLDSISRTLEVALEKESAYNHLEEVTNRIVEIQENDRKILVQELHDNISQKLGVTKMQLEQEIINNNHKNNKALEEISQNISIVSSALRNLANDIRPILLENFGFIEAAKFYLKQYKNEFNIEFNYSKDIKINKWNIKINLFRCFQEIIFNIKKHSKANKISISLSNDNNNLILNISDDGIGFDINNLSDSDKKIMRFGLLNITERIDFINGKIDLNSEPGKGTAFIITVPT